MLNAEILPDHYMWLNIWAAFKCYIMIVRVSYSLLSYFFGDKNVFFFSAEKFDLANYTGVDKSKIVGMLSTNSWILKSVYQHISH